MTQEVRTPILLYLRQKYTDVRTDPSSPLYASIVGDVRGWLQSHYPQIYANRQFAQKEAQDVVNEVVVRGEKENRGQGPEGGAVRGNISMGYNVAQNRATGN